MNGEKIAFCEANEGIVQGAPERGAVLISHGAGGTMATPLLARIAEQLSANGFLTLRWNFGYIKTGKPPSAGGKREIPEMNAAIDLLVRECDRQKPIVLIGKSFGARVSTYVAADRPDDIAGFAFLGLPLQGGGKNAKPRDWSHLAKLKGKILFITGDKDSLCKLNDLEKAQSLLTVPFESEVVAGDHSFKPRGEEQARQKCIEWVDKSFP